MAPRGDEGELFERYHDRLVRITAWQVKASREDVEEACAFAWVQLLSHEVRRETAFAWLKEVARREAIRLANRQRDVAPLGQRPGEIDPERLPVDSGNPAVTPERWRVALERLQELPELDRRIVAMKAFGWRYADLAVELGISETRINQILSRAYAQLHEIEALERPPRTAKVARLRELEANPPRYLRLAIGRPPAITRASAIEQYRREWRRLALAIEDYRAAYEITDPKRALGPAARTRDQRVKRDELRDRIECFTRDLSRAHA